MRPYVAISLLVLFLLACSTMTLTIDSNPAEPTQADVQIIAVTVVAPTPFPTVQIPTSVVRPDYRATADAVERNGRVIGDAAKQLEDFSKTIK